MRRVSELTERAMSEADSEVLGERSDALGDMLAKSHARAEEIDQINQIAGAWQLATQGLHDYGAVAEQIATTTLLQFTDAAGEAFHTIISGQDNAAANFQERMRQILDGLGQELWALSFKYLAIALAETFTNPADSATHWAAFGVATAGAAAVSGLSGLAGAPGGAGAAGASGGGTRDGGRNTEGLSSSGGGTTVNETHIHVHGMYGSEAQAARAIRGAVRTAEVQGEVRSSKGQRRAA
jgi:hypothetical protein